MAAKLTYTTWVKTGHSTLTDSFAKCWLSFQLISPSDSAVIATSCAGGRHNMLPPRASGNSGRWHINCWRRDKLCGDLNSQPKRPGDLELWPFDLESGVWVMRDVGYLSANFSLPRPLCSRLRPNVYTTDVRRRQTDRRQTDVRLASSLNAPAYGVGA